MQWNQILAQNRDFCLPQPASGVLPPEFDTENSNSLATRRWKHFEDMFIRFDAVHEHDGQTPHDSQGRAWCGKTVHGRTTSTQNNNKRLIVRSDKSVAYVTSNKRLCSTWHYVGLTTEVNYWQTRSIARLLCDSRATCKFTCNVWKIRDFRRISGSRKRFEILSYAQLPWRTNRNSYQMAILPIILYGFKCTHCLHGPGRQIAMGTI